MKKFIQYIHMYVCIFKARVNFYNHHQILVCIKQEPNISERSIR